MSRKKIRTQTELARRMGITKNQLSVILSEKYDPIKSSTMQLCDALAVPLEDILIVKDEKQDDYCAQLELDFGGLAKKDAYIDTSQVRPNRSFKVLELFAGAGGLALGLSRAGFNAVGLVEIDHDCCETLRYNRPNWNVIEQDIVKVAEQGIRTFLREEDWDIDLLSGGYPCQAFSYSGKKLGLNDVRGTMFYYFADILQDLKPKMFLVENVRGLLSHDNGRTLQTMVNVFTEVGYKVTYKVLNAVDYNVAQKRERLVIVGVRDDYEGITFGYPKPSENRLVLRDVLQDVPESEGIEYSEKKKRVLELVPPGGCWRDLPEEIAKEYMGKSYYSSGGRTGIARRIAWDEPCLTLTCSPAQKQTERCHPEETRPFTVREYARIQSFPDDWHFCGSVYSKYRQIGNAVPVNFAEFIGLAIVNCLNQMTNLEATKTIEVVAV